MQYSGARAGTGGHELPYPDWSFLFSKSHFLFIMNFESVILSDPLLGRLSYLELIVSLHNGKEVLFLCNKGNALVRRAFFFWLEFFKYLFLLAYC